ncbi:MAG: serine/threonine-protein kinase [Polyangiaceae bacterium]
MEERSRRATADRGTIHEVQPGDVLDGRYELVERIGRGGFGDVWRAIELLPDGAPLRDVALKLLASDVAVSGWAEEAKLLASFRHPSLVTIYGAGILEKPKAPFVAMELLIGETLAETLKRVPRLPWRAVLRIAREVAAALDVIHVRGVAHLDLKPANLFVTQEGTVKVLDFGISRTAGVARHVTRGRPAPRPPDDEASTSTAAFLAESSAPYAATQLADAIAETVAKEVAEATGTGSAKMVVGTPGYVAPEVLQLAEPTALADAYALGVTIGVLATGRFPQDCEEEPPDGSDGEVYKRFWYGLRDATLKGSLRDLEKDGLPRGLAALVARLTSVDPERREVKPGGLAALVEEVWRRPNGVVGQPYPGLAPFGRQHEGLLFGRDPELARMLRHLADEPLVVVAGPKGAGKTSFVEALLLPELEKARVDGRMDTETRVVTMRPQPDAALRHALRELHAVLDDGEGLDGDTAFAALGALAGKDRAIVLVLEDFEAIVDIPEAERALVTALVERALDAKVPGVRLVIVIDQEDVDRVLALGGPAPRASLDRLAASVRYLAPPVEAVAAEIALEPARAAGMPIVAPDELVRAVERELGAGGVPLPAVALLLRTAVAGGKLDGTRIAVPTAFSSALYAHAESVVEPLAREDAERVVALLVALTSSDGAALRVPIKQLCDRLGEDSVDALLGKLTQANLARVRGGAAELVHPVLARWPRIESARLASMDVIALRERLATAAAAWEHASFRQDYLDRGELLSALDLRSLSVRGLTGIEVEFLSASRRARRRRRAMRLGAAVIALLTLVVAFAYKAKLDRDRHAAEQAEERARLEARRVRLVARARQTHDPYARVAYLVAALRLGVDEPALYVELLGAANNLPPGRFLSLDPIEAPKMPWDERWLVGRSPTGALVVFDLTPTSSEPEVIEHDLSIDLSKTSALWRKPKRFDLAIGETPLVDIVPLSYDTALLARNTAGEVQLIRLREDGVPALAAVAPMRCRGDLVAAQRAPVVACVGGNRIWLWDFVRETTHTIDESSRPFALSPDGTRVATWKGSSFTVYSAFEDTPAKSGEITGSIRVASFSPRDPILAIATEDHVLAVDANAPSRVLVDRPSTQNIVTLRWDEGGLDVAACKLSGLDEWIYLRKGERLETELPPAGRCDDARLGAPDVASSRYDLREFAMRDFGEHFSRGAFHLTGDRWLSSTLVLAAAQDDALERVMLFTRRDDKLQKKPVAKTDGFTRISRVGDIAAVELARTQERVREHGLPDIEVLEADTGKRVLSSTGFLLSACSSGRIVAYRPEGDRYAIVDVRTATEMGSVKRVPGFVVGISPSCEKVYTQTLEGTLLVTKLVQGQPAPDAQIVATSTGYVFDTEASASFDGGNAGLLLAFSSGEVARVDERDDTLRILAYAKPRASALGDGPLPGEALFADATGVHRVLADGTITEIARPRAGASWEDVLATQDGRAVLLASADELAVVDTRLKAVTGSVELAGMTRLTAWGPDGSALVYAPDIEGIARAIVVPFGPKLVEAIGAIASNLRVDDAGNLMLKR